MVPREKQKMPSITTVFLPCQAAVWLMLDLGYGINRNASDIIDGGLSLTSFLAVSMCFFRTWTLSGLVIRWHWLGKVSIPISIFIESKNGFSLLEL